MAIYYVKHRNKYIYSIRLFIGFIISILVTIVAGITILEKHGNIYILGLILSSVWFFLHRISSNIFVINLKLEVTNMGLKINYLKYQSYFKNIYVDWGNIKEYIIKNDPYFTHFKIKCKDGSKVRFSHSTSDADDFEKFRADFEKKVTEYPLKIEKGKTFYETKFGLIIAGFLIITMIAWPIICFVNESEFKVGLALSFYSSSIFIVLQVYLNQFRINKATGV